MFRFLPALALSIALASGAAGALPARAAIAADATVISPDETRQAQQVVRAQLAALATDNAELAFSYASASIRQMFGTAAQFMTMVRRSYPVVYRPAAVVFLKPEMVDGELVQPVHMTDHTGATWLALYSLLRQDDKSWRISGCVLIPRAGKTV